LIRFAARLAVLLACAPLALAACGGSKKALSPAELVRRGDAICHDQSERERKLPRPAFDPSRATPADLKAAASYLDKDVPIFVDAATRFRALGLPTRDRERFGRLFDVLDRVVQANQEARAAADRGDLPGFRRAFASVAKPAAQSALLLQQLGFKVCGRAPAPARD
jgi:hypothetical protein